MGVNMEDYNILPTLDTDYRHRSQDAEGAGHEHKMVTNDINNDNNNLDNLTLVHGGQGPAWSDYNIKLFQVTVPTVFGLFVLVGLLGNSLVIYVILSRKRLQTVTNILLLNLALADVSFLLICGGFTVVHYAMTEWPFSDNLCRLVQYLLYVTCYVTVYTLMAVSAVRYVTIVYGPHSPLIRRRRNVAVLIIIIWIVFLVAKVPILLVHGVSRDSNTNRLECIISGKTDGQKLFATFFVFAYSLPLAAICTLYLLMLCHLTKARKDMSLAVSPNSQERNRQVTRVVLVVVAVFAICWLPLHVHLLVAYYGTVPSWQYYPILLLLWHCLAFANSLLNPLIYNCFSIDFRSGFAEVVCCHKPEVEV